MDIISYLYPLYLLLSMLDPSIQLPEVKTIEYIGNYRTTGYYAPLPGQNFYFQGSYEADKAMNCGEGSCFHTANGYELSAKDEMSVVACPPLFCIRHYSTNRVIVRGGMSRPMREYKRQETRYMEWYSRCMSQEYKDLSISGWSL